MLKKRFALHPSLPITRNIEMGVGGAATSARRQMEAPNRLEGGKSQPRTGILNVDFTSKAQTISVGEQSRRAHESSTSTLPSRHAAEAKLVFEYSRLFLPSMDPMKGSCTYSKMRTSRERPDARNTCPYFAVAMHPTMVLCACRLLWPHCGDG